MNKFIPGFRFYRMADGEGAGGGTAAATAAAAVGTSATTTTGADGKTTTVGDAAAASQQNNSATATVSSVGTGTDTTTTTAPDFKTSLGEFGKDPMFADFKDVAGLAKSYAETKKLVGQKLGIPGADATPEAKAAFYKAIGVPDTAEGYALKVPDNLPESIKQYYESDMLKGFAEVAKKLNMTPEQTKGIQGWYDTESGKTIEQVTNDVTRSDADLDVRATKTFGDQKQAILQQAQVDLVKYSAPENKALLENAPNQYLIAVAEVARGIRKELGGEDKAIPNNGDAASGQSAGQLRAEARRLMALPEYSNPFAKGKEVHEALKKQVQGMFTQVAELEKQGVKK